jgi:methionyl-tRNA formyltransferase
MHPPRNQKNSCFSVLFVGDPHLGQKGFRIVQEYFEKPTCLIWQKGALPQKRAIRKFIRSGHWDILISFYNDLIFQEEELSRIDLALNIHPSSPALRGVGYDMLPLIEDHKNYGATLHYIIREIDAGKILDVMEEKIPEGITHQQFRPLTQGLCLQMLTKTVKYLSSFNQLRDFYQMIGLETRHQKVGWCSSYCSTEKLHKLVEELMTKDPNHRVFR